MRRIVFITQQVDPGHPALAATVAQIAALAARVDEVVVLADGAVAGVLPENCRVHRFAASSKAGRGLRFEAALARELRRHPERIVAHMCPIYAVLAAPLARPLGVRVLLWYTHWHASPTLRVAERLASAIVSVDRRSFPLDSTKVQAIGHGIDLAAFPCAERPEREGLQVLALGRYSPAKGLETVIRAVAQVEGARLTVHGPELGPLERTHRQELERLVADLGAPITLGDAVPREQIPALLAGADVLVNNMREGALDKVVYEAAASCVPVLASNSGFAELVEPFRREDAAELAERLRALVALPADERTRIGRELRAKVEARHSVESWAEGVLAA
ncbi:MAG: glycosyltransferase family 4 protein [Gaiellaceae bacterium]